MKSERRVAKRDAIDPIEITGFTSMDHMTLISRTGHITDASSTGFCIELGHRDLVPKMLRDNLSLDLLVGDQVILFIPKMNLELSGKVARTKLVGNKRHEIAIDFSDDAPEYWRECLFELLPRPGELD
jgi:hypothetical protein